MTGDAGEGLAVSRVLDLFTDGMGEFALRLMTSHTHGIRIPLKHPGKTRAMALVTIETLLPGRMNMKTLSLLNQSLWMTPNAEPVRRGSKKKFLV